MSESWIEEALRQWREARRPEALGELLKAQRDRAYSVALRLTASPADAEDAVQDACVKLLSRTKGFEDRASFEVAVYRAVVQCALDRVRARRRSQAREAAAGDAQALLKALEDPAVDVAEEREITAELRQAVAALPEDERAPVVLCYYQGLSVAQAAEALEVPRETLRARLNKTLEALRLRLKEKDRKVARGAILGLLWRDGSASAPPSLCEALDQALPGRPCHEVPALAQAGPAATPGIAEPRLGRLSGAKLAAAAAGVVLAAVVYLGLARMAAPAGAVGELEGQEPRASSPVGGRARTPAPPQSVANVETVGKTPTLGGNMEPVISRPSDGQTERKVRVDAVSTRLQEGSDMKASLMTSVLAGGVLFSGVVLAGDPNPDVAKVIEQIAARRVEKAEAQAAMQKEAATREGRWGGQSAPRAGFMQPGAGGGTQVIIREGGQ